MVFQTHSFSCTMYMFYSTAEYCGNEEGIMNMKFIADYIVSVSEMRKDVAYKKKTNHMFFVACSGFRSILVFSFIFSTPFFISFVMVVVSMKEHSSVCVFVCVPFRRPGRFKDSKYTFGTQCKKQDLQMCTNLCSALKNHTKPLNA